MSDVARRNRNNKAKGRKAENIIVEYLADPEYFPGAERRRQAGAKDRGDVTGVPYWTLEIKSGPLQVTPWLREADREAANAGTINRAVLWKPPGIGRASVADCVFFAPLWLGRRIMKEYQ